ncbi:hypothetical protein [Spongiibacter tropicus]|uniref:hypothetical protein n=1 Tax=Spongiibacter tropicus TaxID=454602 RepID=UPI003A990E67
MNMPLPRLAAGLIVSLSLLSACSMSPSEPQTLYAESGQPVQFTGRMHSGLPAEGQLSFANGSQFEGRFDREGFPAKGRLTQHYVDAEGETLTLILEGRFKHRGSSQRLEFKGDFQISDSEGRLLAEGRESVWGSDYRSPLFRLPPALFALDGQRRYRQYRRDISPASDPRRFLTVHRPMSGPFIVNARYEEGLPRGVAKVSAELSDGARYVVERQYFNYQLPNQRNHYYYFEPGSYERVSVIGECEAPNITVPRELISVYAYDCDDGNFYALSESMPASVLSIAAEQLDNSGRFHQIRILHHGNTSEFEVDAEALLRGELLADGLYTEWHYGQLHAAYMASHGQPVGVGMALAHHTESVFVSHRLKNSQTEFPSTSLIETLKVSATERQQAMRQDFARLMVGSRLSERRAEQLKAALEAHIAAPAPSMMADYLGLMSLYQQWQTEAATMVDNWPWQSRRNATDIARLRDALLGKLAMYRERQESLLNDAARQHCLASGQRFDALRWECRLEPEPAIFELCQHTYGINRCEAMQTALQANAAGQQP